MDFKSFKAQLEKYLPSPAVDCTIGEDLSVNTRITVDSDGFIHVRDRNSFKRRKTSINVQDVVEFREDDFYTRDSANYTFYIIAKNDSGLQIECSEKIEIYYCENGQTTEDGTAVEHFDRLSSEE